MIVLVAGGRDYSNSHHMKITLDMLFRDFPDTCILQGGARGADRLAKWYCTSNGKPCLTMDAPWEKYGDISGTMRNQWMLDYCKPQMVLCFPGGPGTRDMFNRASKQGFKAYNV